MIKRSFRYVVLATALGLAGCGPGNIRGTDFDGVAPDQIYQIGEERLAAGQESDAAWAFGEVERLYPYSEFARRALLMQAYAFHLDQAYDDSRASAQRYLEFYPAAPDAAYAQYLAALSWYDQIEQVGRDQGVTINALGELTKVFEFYPESEYAAPARARFDLAWDRLGGKEMEVGRYYLRRGFYTAAISRFRTVVEEFETTRHTAEALHRLVESYLFLGLTNEARTAAAILGHNFPDSEWYRDSHALLTGRGLRPEPVGNSWIAQIYRQTIRGDWL